MQTIGEVLLRVGGHIQTDPDLQYVQLRGKTYDVSCYSRMSFFKIKDESNNIGCVSFQNLGEILKADLDILVSGTIGLYKNNLQLRVIEIQVLGQTDDGLGAQIEKLSPYFREPHLLSPLTWRMGIVSSLGAAGLRDYLKTLPLGRFQITVYPTTVQGESAPAGIVRSIQQAISDQMQVVVLVRGGGSREDLTAFDHLDVGKAICASSIPVVTGIGHQIDTVLADMVADGCCITPTDAANKMAEIPGPNRLLSEAMYDALSSRHTLLSSARKRIESQLTREHTDWCASYHDLSRDLHQAMLSYRNTLAVGKQRIWREYARQLDSKYKQAMCERDTDLAAWRTKIQKAQTIRVLQGDREIQSIHQLQGEFKLLLPDGIAHCIRLSDHKQIDDRS